MWRTFVLLAANGCHADETCFLQMPQQLQASYLANSLEEPVWALEKLSNRSLKLLATFEEMSERKRIRKRLLDKSHDPSVMHSDKQRDNAAMMSQDFYNRLSSQDAKLMVLENLNVIALVLILTPLWLACGWWCSPCQLTRSPRFEGGIYVESL